MSRSIFDLPTPCFLIDKDRLQKNADRMISICKDLNVSLRPNTKTHKTIEIAEMSTGGTKRCIEVSTLVEAEMYADAGFDDILYAYPITNEKIDRCVELMGRLSEFHVMVCDLSGVECLKANMDKLPAGKTWSVALELDLGFGRTGFNPDSNDFVKAYREIVKTMTLLSLYYFSGDAYIIRKRSERMQREHDVVHSLIACQNKILSEFPNVKFILGNGSTPTCSEKMDIHRCLVGEFHPGSYVFNDYEQYLAQTCRQSDIVCRVMTKVIAHKEEKGMLIVDCGSLGLGHAGIKQRPDDFCIVEGETNLKVVGLCQEMGMIQAKEGDLDCKKYPVGTILFIYPYQAAATAAFYPKFHVHSEEDVVDIWRPCKGW